MYAHYISSDSQNDFIAACAGVAKSFVLNELKLSKYFSIFVDATPDSSHVEQTAFIFRYVSLSLYEGYHIRECFLEFVDCDGIMANW